MTSSYLTTITLLLAATSVLSQTNTGLLNHFNRVNFGTKYLNEPMNLLDLLRVINGIRTTPKRYADRVNTVYKSRLDGNGRHLVFGKQYATPKSTTTTTTTPTTTTPTTAQENSTPDGNTGTTNPAGTATSGTNTNTNTNSALGVAANANFANLDTTQLDGLITFLNTSASVPAVQLDRGLTQAAYKANVDADTRGLLARINDYGTLPTGDVAQEATHATLAGGNSAEYLILDFMFDAQANRNFIMNTNWRWFGANALKRDPTYFVDMIFATQGYTCDKCYLITEDQRIKSGWRTYEWNTYNPPDTDGNLRLDKVCRILMSGVALLAVLAQLL